MAGQGLRSLFPPEELALMGFVEVLPHLRRLLRRIGQVSAAILAEPPDVLVTIDSPAFSLRVARRVAGRAIPLVHYVAPSVWAWRPGRAQKIARFLDLLLTLLPFEPPYFERHGLRSVYVGHPIVETVPSQRDAAGFRRRHGLAADAPLLLVLPGSRRSEVRYHMPVFADAVERLHRSHPGLHAVIPTVPGVAAAVRAAAAHWRVPTIVLSDPAEKFDAFAAGDAALSSSGTATLELAVTGLPTVVAYKSSWLSAEIFRRLTLIRHASLVNILADRQVQPEFLQENCRAELLSGAVDRLLTDPAAAQAQRSGFRMVIDRLAVPVAPSERAADAILELLGGRRRGAAGPVRTAAAGP
jgi:lipid-A-disaccharide synthase